MFGIIVFWGGPVTAAVRSMYRVELMSESTAAFHRISLLLGVECIDDVIRWADVEIERSTVPTQALIDISLGRSRSRDQIIDLLAGLVDDWNDDAPLKAVLTIIASQIRDGRLDVEETIENIYNYTKRECADSELHWTFMALAEDLSCIRDGVLTKWSIDDLRDELMTGIQEFCDTERDRTRP